MSSSCLAYVPGKDPRPILNLSSQNDGVSQRMDDLPLEQDGYTAIPKIAAKTVFTYIDMVQNPGKYSIKDVNDIDLAMFVADASGNGTLSPLCSSGHKSSNKIRCHRTGHRNTLSGMVWCMICGVVFCDVV